MRAQGRSLHFARSFGDGVEDHSYISLQSAPFQVDKAALRVQRNVQIQTSQKAEMLLHRGAKASLDPVARYGIAHDAAHGKAHTGSHMDAVARILRRLPNGVEVADVLAELLSARGIHALKVGVAAQAAFAPGLGGVHGLWTRKNEGRIHRGCAFVVWKITHLAYKSKRLKVQPKELVAETGANSDLVTALGAAAIQNSLTGLGLHAGQKSVGLRTATSVGLEGSLRHNALSFKS